MDEFTFKRIERLIRAAHTSGLHPVEALDAGRALLTPQRRRILRLEALHDFRTSFARWQPHEYLRRYHTGGPYTPEQMHRAIAEYLDDFIELEAKENG
jgi:hypothetical protein